MFEHKVELYRFVDGSYYVAPRKGRLRNPSEIMADAHRRTDVSSPVYEKSRAGELVEVTALFEDLSKSQAKERQISVIRTLEALGLKVLNVKV